MSPSMTRVMLLCALMVTAACLWGQQEPTPDQLIQDGEKYSTEAFDNQKALDAFKKAEKLAPNNYEVLWRISRSYVDIGEHLPVKTDEEKAKQLETYMLAVEYADRAISVNANGSMAYTRRAIANGRVALFKGIWESISLVKQVKADCEKAIQLDASNAAAYYVFARTHYKVSEKSKIFRWPLGLSWANREESAALFEKAISLRPNFIMYRLDAAKLYIDEDQPEKAKAHLTAIAGLPKEDEDDDQFRAEAKQLLTTIK